jgi:hypothetical protein
VKWTDSLYAYCYPSTGPLQDRDYERTKLRLAFAWRLRDKEVIDLLENYFNEKEEDDDYDPEEDKRGVLVDGYLAFRMNRLKERRIRQNVSAGLFNKVRP